MFSFSIIHNSKEVVLVEDYHHNARVMVDGFCIAYLNCSYANSFYKKYLCSNGFKQTSPKHFTRHQRGTFAGSPMFVSNHGWHENMGKETTTIKCHNLNNEGAFRSHKSFESLMQEIDIEIQKYF